MRRSTLFAALVALFLVVGVLPALADDATEPTEPTVEEDADEEPGAINGKFMILFAEGFDVGEEELVALRELQLGFGDIFKLNLYASVLGVTVEELVEGAEFDPETGEYEFDWGTLRQSLTDEQLALLDEMPRNFGQLVSEQRRHQGREAHQPATEAGEGDGEDAGDHPGQGRGLDKHDGKPGKGSKPAHAGKGGRAGGS